MGGRCLQPVEPVCHDAEHGAETTEHGSESAQHDAQQPAEIGPMLGCQSVDAPIDRLKSTAYCLETTLEPVQRRSSGSRDVLQGRDPARHDRRIAATIRWLNW